MDNKEVEIFACLLDMDKKKLNLIYAQILEIKKEKLIDFNSELREDESEIGVLDDFEKRAIAWINSQKDKYLSALVRDILIARILLRLEFTGEFVFRKGFKIVSCVKSPIQGRHNWLIRQGSANKRELPI